MFINQQERIVRIGCMKTLYTLEIGFKDMENITTCLQKFDIKMSSMQPVP